MRSKPKLEKRLTTGLNAALEAFETSKFLIMEWIRSDENIANGLAKPEKAKPRKT